MEERDFFLEARAPRSAVLQCPFCRTTGDYDLIWLFRKKRTNINLDRLDERDRARFEKAASYMVLLDDVVACSNPNCRRRFEISGVKTMAFVTPEQLQEVEFGREGRDAGRAGQSYVRGGQGQQRGYSGPRAGQGKPGGGSPAGPGTNRPVSQSPARQGRGGGPPQDRDDNIGNRIDDRSSAQRGAYGQQYGRAAYGQQGSGQQGFGKAKKQNPSGPGNRQAGPRDVRPPRQDDAQPLRSPRGKRSDPTGPGGGWR